MSGASKMPSYLGLLLLLQPLPLLIASIPRSLSFSAQQQLLNTFLLQFLTLPLGVSLWLVLLPSRGVGSSTHPSILYRSKAMQAGANERPYYYNTQQTSVIKGRTTASFGVDVVIHTGGG